MSIFLLKIWSLRKWIQIDLIYYFCHVKTPKSPAAQDMIITILHSFQDNSVAHYYSFMTSHYWEKQNPEEMCIHVINKSWGVQYLRRQDLLRSAVQDCITTCCKQVTPALRNVSHKSSSCYLSILNINEPIYCLYAKKSRLHPRKVWKSTENEPLLSCTEKGNKLFLRR